MNIRSKIFGGGTPDQPIIKAKKPKRSPDAATPKLSALDVPRAESRRANNRAADRHRLTGESVRFTHQGRDYQAELVNLSGGGAMLDGPPQMLKLWDRVDLHLGDHGTTECAVRWIRGKRVGLEFAHETQLHCSADQRASVLREAIARSFPEMTFAAPAASQDESAHLTSGDEHRGAPRHALIWSATLHHDFQSSKVRLRNISSSGAMLDVAKAAPVGADLVLEFDSGTALGGTVAWAVGDHLGLRFYSEFDMAVLGKSAPQVTPSEWTPPTYLSKVAALGTPWDPRWNRLSVDQLKQELEGYLRH